VVVVSKVQIEINGRRYAIGCDDGQEDHVLRLARYFDDHVKRLAQAVGQIGEQRLFLMGALIVADEAHDLKLRLDRAEAELARLRDTRAAEVAEVARPVADPAPAVHAASGALDDAAARLERLAERLEQA
jgi:cell division protein ZapA